MEGTKFSLESETYLRYLHKQCEKYPLYCRSYGFLMETSESVCDVCKRLSIYRASLFCDQRFKWNSRMLRRGAEWIWTLENNWILHDIHVLGTHPSLNIYTPKAMSKYLKHMLSYGAFDFPLMVWGEYVCWSFLLWFSADLMGESRKTWSGLGWSTSRQILYSSSWRIWHIIKLLYLFIYHHNQSPLACSHIWKCWQ